MFWLCSPTVQVVYISEGSLYNIVVLDPTWLGLRIFGPALSPENSIFPKLKSVTGRVTLKEIQRIYPEWDAPSIAHLFEHFEFCCPQDKSRTVFEFPCLMKMQPLFGLWTKEPNFVVYAGVHLRCQRNSDIFSPGIFPKLQVHFRRTFSSDDIDDQELTLWTDGLKCCRGEVEVQVQLVEAHKTIEIVVRGSDETQAECYALLQQFYSETLLSIRTTNPGTSFTTRILSARDLKEHRRPPASYSAVQIFEAERGDGAVRHANPEIQLEEHILDLVCCGCEDVLMAAKSAPYASLCDIPLQTRAQLCQMLDPPDPFGRDWCLLALQLGLTESVPAIDQARDRGSPTDKLLLSWEKEMNGTVVSIIEALRGIGRDDVAQVLIEGLSLFRNSSSPVVVSVTGVALTAYVC